MPDTPDNKKYHGLALFSGGLDSILACKVVQDQGKKVLGLHFITPFFGKPRAVGWWKKQYGVDVSVQDISQEYVDMLVAPEHGYGKLLNPCVDCKILMLKKAGALLDKYGAEFLISGEVVGQRPMSQRKDALNLIRNKACVREVLVRPLCARRIDPTPVEEAGLLDREQLLDIWGRGRKEQLRLAKEVYGFTEIPTPGGGCLLTEAENAVRFWMVMRAKPRPEPGDFLLAQVGRQLFNEGGQGDKWLCIGRNQRDNEALRERALPTDYGFEVRDYPGPSGLGRPLPDPEQGEWTGEQVLQAAALVAGYSPKAVRAAKQGREIVVQVSRQGARQDVAVTPDKNLPGWAEPVLDEDAFKRWKKDRGSRSENENEVG